LSMLRCVEMVRMGLPSVSTIAHTVPSPRLSSRATPHPDALSPQRPVIDAAACPRQPSTQCSKAALRCVSSAPPPPLVCSSRSLRNDSPERPLLVGVAVQGLGLDRCGLAAPFLLWSSCNSRNRGLLHTKPQSRAASLVRAQRYIVVALPASLQGILRNSLASVSAVASPAPPLRLSQPSLGPRRVQVHRRQHQLRPATDAATRPRASCAFCASRALNAPRLRSLTPPRPDGGHSGSLRSIEAAACVGHVLV
jgi:hypothetical protein